ncbi:hypothetical protein IAQ61_005214 [Plenodomus lingam]|uniref:uncharacterized protein n=1 Tax=Leptosphaeria maculans TaxID=5022 RepID=UPI0033299A4A|nr:hypothetical protein IAQ61_005214 [Plenodomus lingam]
MAEIAIGIISLSIPICQGLISYIDGFKNAKSKAEQIRSESERLASLLELLDNTIGKLDHNECVTASRTGIIACASALESIRKSVGEPTKVVGSKPRFSFQVLAKRFAAPFKEADVKYRKDVLSNAEKVECLITQLARSNHDSMQQILTRHQDFAQSTLSYNDEQRLLSQHETTASEQRVESFRHDIASVQMTLQSMTSNIAHLATLS